MKQVARNMTDACDGFPTGRRFLIIDRDTKYCSDFADLVEGAGTKILRLPARSPNLNAHAERFVRTIKDECTRRIILFGEQPVRRATAEFVEHYNRERFDQAWPTSC